MAQVFRGAVFEADNDNLASAIEDVMDNLEDVKSKTYEYGSKIAGSRDRISDIIIKEARK